jgi:glucose-6-phosphate 1-dehydrogenase
MLQTVAAVAMEPPASSSSQDVDARRTQLLGDINTV